MRLLWLDGQAAEVILERRTYANEIFASGPVELRLGHGGAWTSRHDVGLRRAYVYDLSQDVTARSHQTT